MEISHIGGGKKIAVIGASYLQLPLVQKCKEMGLEVHCFAWKEGAVCSEFADYFYPISIVDKEKILRICEKVRIDGIISVASDVAVPTIAYVAEKMGLVSNSFQSTSVCTNKFLMRNCFCENKILSPQFFLAKDTNINDNLKFPLIVKPTDRSGSLGVEKVTNVNELRSAIARAQEYSFSKQAIIEDYIEGKEVSVESISCQGTHYILAITDKVTTGEPNFVELEHHIPSTLDKLLMEQVKNQTINALDALGIRFGASHSEFKITKDNKVYILEVGARMGGDFIGSDLVFLATGYDFLGAIIDVALGEFKKPELLQKKYSGVYFLCEQTKHLVSKFGNSKIIKEITKAEVTSGELKMAKCSADRSGYFIYQSDKPFNV